MDHGRAEWVGDMGVLVDDTKELVHRPDEWEGGNVPEVTELAVFTILVSATVWEEAGVMFLGIPGVPVVTFGSNATSLSTSS